ncbi:hypothetical protein GGTG_05986 [Gaeumannomyces tritici R3-111a-1]|uniref:Uncharacterized protein n=1 Tax=Gaeumannomyces tritici (strain R3-111a-1) TaxID=644352 RepID=J3NXI0_GAET3|nr:hypothetical protein GGTG_05986 [Gaeumannomyces tritici R3-111a-1]EJT76062.1 hypothetical protein GGTG_05986 [Gaeumannomyces tritici R3-111a-1]
MATTISSLRGSLHRSLARHLLPAALGPQPLPTPLPLSRRPTATLPTPPPPASRPFHAHAPLRNMKPPKKGGGGKSEAAKTAKAALAAQKARVAARRDKAAAGANQADPKLLAFRRVVLQREARTRCLMRQWQSMRAACEELRLTAGPGARDEGYLYRVAMEKKGVYGHNGVPIEYARPQTETPPRQPWNHDWKR